MRRSGLGRLAAAVGRAVGRVFGIRAKPVHPSKSERKAARKVLIDKAEAEHVATYGPRR